MFLGCGALSYDQVLYREAFLPGCVPCTLLCQTGACCSDGLNTCTCHRRAVESRWCFFCPQPFITEYNYGRIYSIPQKALHYKPCFSKWNMQNLVRSKSLMQPRPSRSSSETGPKPYYYRHVDKTHGLSLYRIVTYDQSPFHTTESVRLEQTFELIESNL